MLVLGINTSADTCEAALFGDGALIVELSEPMNQGHDARLAPVVEQVMSGRSFADLSRIAVVVGPGSFTGLRTGVAFARGLSLALGIPAVGITSLEALDGLPQNKRVLGLLPAKRRPPEQTWWAQVLVNGQGAGDCLELDMDGVRDLASTSDAVCGAAFEISGLTAPHIAASTTAAAAARLAARFESDKLPAPQPVYVREPDAKPMARP